MSSSYSALCIWSSLLSVLCVSFSLLWLLNRRFSLTFLPAGGHRHCLYHVLYVSAFINVSIKYGDHRHFHTISSTISVISIFTLNEVVSYRFCQRCRLLICRLSFLSMQFGSYCIPDHEIFNSSRSRWRNWCQPSSMTFIILFSTMLFESSIKKSWHLV